MDASGHAEDAASGTVTEWTAGTQEVTKDGTYTVSVADIKASAVDEETGEEIKLSKSQAKDYERRIIAEARRKQAEMYGDGSVSSDNDDE